MFSFLEIQQYDWDIRIFYMNKDVWLWKIIRDKDKD